MFILQEAVHSDMRLSVGTRVTRSILAYHAVIQLECMSGLSNYTFNKSLSRPHPRRDRSQRLRLVRRLGCPFVSCVEGSLSFSGSKGMISVVVVVVVVIRYTQRRRRQEARTQPPRQETNSTPLLPFRL